MKRSLLVAVIVAAALGIFAAPAGAVTITSASVTGPAFIPPSGTATYTLTVTGTRASALFLTNYYKWSIHDDDHGSSDPDQGFFDTNYDDQLVGETSSPIAVGPFTDVFAFNLSCDASGHVVGPGGSSGEPTAEVYAQLESPAGFDLHFTTPSEVHCGNLSTYIKSLETF